MKTYRAISQINNLEQKLFWLVVFLAGGLVFAYVYLVNSTILNAMAKKEAEESIAGLGAEVALLEGQYIIAQNELTIDRAQNLGLVEAGLRASFAYIGGQETVSMR